DLIPAKPSKCSKLWPPIRKEKPPERAARKRKRRVSAPFAWQRRPASSLLGRCFQRAYRNDSARKLSRSPRPAATPVLCSGPQAGGLLMVQAPANHPGEEKRRSTRIA